MLCVFNKNLLYTIVNTKKVIMYLYIIYISLISSLTTFVVALFLTAKFAIDIVFLPGFRKDFSVNSYFAASCSVLVISFLLSFVLLLIFRIISSKNKEYFRSKAFKSISYLAFSLPVILFIILSTAIIASLFSASQSWQSLIVYLGFSFMAFGILDLLFLCLHRMKFFLAFLLFFILTISAIGVSVFTYTKIGPPWLGSILLSDVYKENDLNTLNHDIQSYIASFNKLPRSLDDLPYKNNLNLSQFSYTPKDNTYQLCTTFQLDSKFLQSYGHDVQHPEFAHGSGYTCFYQKAYIAPSPQPLTCTTLNGKMVRGEGFGYIGCDMKVLSGTINLSESYCEGQTTHTREYLIPDSYGRKNRYWTTLQTIDPNEEVKVFATSLSGETTECLPSLNK